MIYLGTYPSIAPGGYIALKEYNDIYTQTYDEEPINDYYIQTLNEVTQPATGSAVGNISTNS